MRDIPDSWLGGLNIVRVCMHAKLLQSCLTIFQIVSILL